MKGELFYHVQISLAILFPRAWPALGREMGLEREWPEGYSGLFYFRDLLLGLLGDLSKEISIFSPLIVSSPYGFPLYSSRTDKGRPFLALSSSLNSALEINLRM